MRNKKQLKYLFNFTSNSYSQFLQNSNPTVFIQQINVQEIDIDFFYISKDSAQQVYRKKKKQAQVYQWVFWGLGILFLFLAMIISQWSIKWTYSLYFYHNSLIRTYLYGFCLLLAPLTFIIGYRMRPEKETTYDLTSTMERQLHAIYKSFNEQPILDQKHSNAQQNYTYALGKIHNWKDYTLELLDQIAHSATHDALTKEQLFSQAILDLHQRLYETVKAFKQTHFSLMLTNSPYENTRS